MLTLKARKYKALRFNGIKTCLVIIRDRLRCFAYGKCKDDADCIKQCMSMETEATRLNQKNLVQLCQEDMIFHPAHDDAQDKDTTESRGQLANPGYLENGR